MTIRELFKKVETYNEIAAVLDTTRARVYWADVVNGHHIGNFFTNYKDFKKHVNNTYFKKWAKAILECDEYGYGVEVEIKVDGEENTTVIAAIAYA